MRRDLTINALFYNLKTEEVEDHTGRGLDDLREGIIRTPLEPRVTFLDGAIPYHILHILRHCADAGQTVSREAERNKR